MCFSATASYAAAAVTGLAGAATLSCVRTWREVPLASIPLVFAAQQAVEGSVWLGLAHQAHDAQHQLLTNLFIYIALGLWPVVVPLSAMLVENVRPRRIAMAGLLVLAIPIAVYGVIDGSLHPYNACVVGHSISYINGKLYPAALLASYVACTVAPMLLSSLRQLKLFGAVLALGLFAAWISFYEALVSVWCFFAAVSSVILVAHFRGRRRVAHPA
jgi:hypothetical protein